MCTKERGNSSRSSENLQMSLLGEECEEKNSQHMEQHVKSHRSEKGMGGWLQMEESCVMGTRPVLWSSWRGGWESCAEAECEWPQSRTEKDFVCLNHVFYFLYFIMLWHCGTLLTWQRPPIPGVANS